MQSESIFLNTSIPIKINIKVTFHFNLKVKFQITSLIMKYKAIVVLTFLVFASLAESQSTQCEREGGLCKAGAIFGCDENGKKNEGCRQVRIAYGCCKPT